MAKHDDCTGDYKCHVAPTLIERFWKCNFLWFAGKIAHRLEKREKPGADLGTFSHGELEAVAKTGDESVMTSQLSQNAWAVVPEAAKRVAIPEYRIDHVDIGLAWPLYGKIDLLAPPTKARRGWVTDYKFSKDPLEFLPQPAKMLDEIQMAVYAWWFILAYREVPRVAQIQVNTQTGTAELVEAEFSQVKLVTTVQMAKLLTLEMARTAVLAPQEVAMNGTPGSGPYCNDYGKKCEAFKYCKDTMRFRRTNSKWEV